MSTHDRIRRLPKWAQNHIESLERRVESLEKTLPWHVPGMDWFTLLHPDHRAPDLRDRHFHLFTLNQDRADSICSIGPNDTVFIGRGKPKQGGAE